MSQTAKDVPIGHAFSLAEFPESTRVRICRPVGDAPNRVYSIETWPELGAFCVTVSDAEVVNVSKEPVNISFEVAEETQ